VRDTQPPHFFLLVLLAAFLSSCGGIVSDPSLPVTVTVTPSSAQPFTGNSVQFSATVQNAPGSAVNWMVNTAAGGNSKWGIIDSTGLYTAPSVAPTPATVTVTAVLQTDFTKTGSASVTVLSPSGIQETLLLSPMLSSVTTSQSLQFNVLTPGVTNTMVNWAVDRMPNGSSTAGSISTSGMYTPLSATGMHVITAILQTNPNATGKATVEVTNFQGTLTWRNDNMRSGVNNQELVLSPSAVNSGSFGILFRCLLDGPAYAQPLYVPNLSIPGAGTHNVVFVATEMDSVFAFDADANPCVQLWHAPVIPVGSQAIATPNLDLTNPYITPFIGITGTPVIDLSTNTLYVAAATVIPTVNSTYNEQLYALNLGTGQQTMPPTAFQLSTSSSKGAPFSPLLENQRAALLLDNGTVYVAFGAYQSQTAYHGWLLAYNASTLQPTGAFNVTPSASQGGIWQSGGGPSADENHNVFVVTGDGPFDAYRGGMSYSDSFLRFGTTGGLSLSDYFTPCNQAMLQANGQDVGASAPLVLPDSAGSTLAPHLMIGGSKGGSLYVVNRDNLGGYDGACPDSPSRVQTVAMPNGGAIFSTPLFWNNSVYVAPANGNLQSFSLTGSMTGGIPSLTPSGSQSPEPLGPQGATPTVSSNGTSNAIIWLIDSSGALANTPAILRAFDPNNLSNEIYNSATAVPRDTAGPAVKFTVPTVANGKVYVGTQTELDVYGLLY
jgi:hypothetical protein